jgi:hypothetical protein
MTEIRQTFPALVQADKGAVPTQIAAQYAVQSLELSREGYTDEAIAVALRIDIKAVRKMIGANL